MLGAASHIIRAQLTFYRLVGQLLSDSLTWSRALVRGIGAVDIAIDAIALVARRVGQTIVTAEEMSICLIIASVLKGILQLGTLGICLVGLATHCDTSQHSRSILDRLVEEELIAHTVTMLIQNLVAIDLAQGTHVGETIDIHTRLTQQVFNGQNHVGETLTARWSMPRSKHAFVVHLVGIVIIALFVDGSTLGRLKGFTHSCLRGRHAVGCLSGDSRRFLYGFVSSSTVVHPPPTKSS